MEVTDNIYDAGKTPEDPGAIFVSPRAEELLAKVRDMGLTPWWDFYDLPPPLVEQLRHLRGVTEAEQVAAGGMRVAPSLPSHQVPGQASGSSAAPITPIPPVPVRPVPGAEYSDSTQELKDYQERQVRKRKLADTIEVAMNELLKMV